MRARFLALLENNGGIIANACRDLSISRQSFYSWREKDEAFRKAWDAAVDRGVDLLEDEAKRRAYEGSEEPIFYRGKKIGHVCRKSDLLLALLLKAHRPKYRERHELTGPGGQPLGANVFVYLPENGRDPEEDARFGAGGEREQ